MAVSFLGPAGLGHQVGALLDVVFVVLKQLQVALATVRAVRCDHSLALRLLNQALSLINALVNTGGDFLPIYKTVSWHLKEGVTYLDRPW